MLERPSIGFFPLLPLQQVGTLSSTRRESGGDVREFEGMSEGNCTFRYGLQAGFGMDRE